MRPPLILAAPGTESRGARASFARFVNAVRHATDGRVFDAFLEVETPSVCEVVGEVNGPCTVVPLTLFDDPRSRSQLAAVAAEPRVTVAPGIGPDWSLAELMVRRLIEAGARADDSIVLAAGEATGAEGVEDVARAARLLSGVWGGRVHVGTLAGPDPGLSDAVDVARAHGGRVVVASYVLTGGRVHDAFAVTGADLVTAPLIDGGPPDARLIDLVVGRTSGRRSNVAG